MKPKILFIDDDIALTSQLAKLLSRAGFEVALAHCGYDALPAVARINPHLVLLDGEIPPGPDGREVLRQLRKQGSDTPVIMLTQYGDAGERSVTLDEGADDYVNKPFEPQELISRIRAVLRRGTDKLSPTSLKTANILRCDNLVLYRSTRRVFLNEDRIELETKSFAVLEYLMLHPDQVIRRRDLLESIWGWEYRDDDALLTVCMAKLRKALDDTSRQTPHFIRTLYGGNALGGYQFIGKVTREG